MLPLMLTLLYQHWNLCDGGFQWLRKGNGAAAAGVAHFLGQLLFFEPSGN